MSKNEQFSFEEALSRLEVIVEKLEDESITLDESIALYEEGIILSKKCTETLEEAELRIQNVAENQTDKKENE